jgi:hypothetical protein
MVYGTSTRNVKGGGIQSLRPRISSVSKVDCVSSRGVETRVGVPKKRNSKKSNGNSIQAYQRTRDLLGESYIVE